MREYYNNSWKEIVDKLQSDIFKGLSNEECLVRRRTYGDNKIDLPESKGTLKILIRASFSLYLVALFIISTYLLYCQEYILGTITTFAYMVNLAIKLLYTNKKHRQIGEIQKLNYSTVVVLRGGVEKVVRSEDLVKGDIVIYKKGSLIGADIRVIRANNLMVDESSITGERFLKEKFESKIDGNISNIGEMKNLLFKGTLIKDGDGVGIVIETGNSSQLGRLLAMLTYASNNKNTLGRKVEMKLGIYSWMSLVLSLGVYLLFRENGQAVKGFYLSLFSIGIFPVSIFLVYYIKGVKRSLNNEGIEIINFSTLDLINDLDILFLDKIGAITKEEMVVRKLFTNNELQLSDMINYNKDVNVQRILDILLLCNNSIYNAADDTGKGGLLEIAYLRFAANKLAYKSTLDARYKRIFEIPMDSDKRFLTTLNKWKKGCRANVKGNLDAVLERCTHIMINGIEKPIEEADIEKIKGIDFNFSLEGLITQGVAYRSFSYQPTPLENIESNLVFVGIVALENVLNEDIEEEIDYIKSRGSIPIIFTEDNIIAANAIGRKIGLIKSDDQVISGVEVNSLTREELIEVLKKVRIFSRITPEIKSKIVGIFTKDNYKVLSLGETLGDLPSLSLSKVGISKGKTPEVVKRICDVYIKENYLKGLFKLFNMAEGFDERIKISLNTYGVFLGVQIIAVNIIILLIEADVSHILVLIFINIILIIYTEIKILHKSLEKIQQNTYKLNVVIFNLILVIIYYIFELLM